MSKQVKDLKVGFFDQRVALQDEQIYDLKKQVRELKK